MKEEKLIKLKEKYPEIKFEKVKHEILYHPENDIGYHYSISGFKGQPELSFYIGSNERIKLLKSILKSDFTFLPEYYGIKTKKEILISVRPINNRSRHTLRRRLSEKPIEIKMNYFGNNLKISIDKVESSKLFEKVNKLKGRYYRLDVLRIKGLKKLQTGNLAEDLRQILNCILFDFSYNYVIPLEPISTETMLRRIPTRRRRIEVPTDVIQTTYKKYIPELIEYFNIGEKVDFPPFRFLCYFHIIEYFSDKSAYHLASQKLKSLMLKPDFHLKTDAYVNKAINFFKAESTKFTTDKIKVKRVISQFVDRNSFKEYLSEISLLDHFNDEIILQCGKELKLSKIDFETDSKFEESLSKRIYSLRCSIVHSNPDFEESKAVPFKSTHENLDILRKEIDMIYEVSRQIILGSKE